MTRLRAAGGALLLGVLLACSGCSLFSPGPSAEAEVAAAVQEADPRVTEVTVESGVSGLASGWIVDVVLDGADPVSADELGALLSAARHAREREPGYIDLFATSPDGAVIDLAAPADELGVRYSNISTGISVVRDAIDEVLGTDG